MQIWFDLSVASTYRMHRVYQALSIASELLTTRKPNEAGFLVEAAIRRVAA